MADFDLIPPDFHHLLWFKAKIRHFAVALGGLLLLVVATYAGMHWATQNNAAAIAQLQSKKNVTDHQRLELSQLVSNQALMQGQLDFLRGLQGGVPARQMFHSIDRSIDPGRVWLQQIEYRREGRAVNPGENTLPVGSLLVQPLQETAQSGGWTIESRMKLRGQATDHVALSNFVDRLYQQGEVQDVRIVSTSLAREAGIVEFDLVVLVNNALGTPS